MEDLVSLCKRRGFIFQSNDIYGGMKGLYDFGPMGVELKLNLKSAWWKSIVYERDDVEGLDSTILTSPTVLKYSGHEDTFSDPLVDCKKCKSRWRADQLEDGKCPNCKSTDLTDPRPFNLMFKTAIGPVDDGSSFAYLRPETAQQIFVNFKNVVDSTSRVPPFGIAQIGKAFRNEITPRNFIFRVREFEQMELEYFVKPGSDESWHKYWVDKRLNWWADQGVKSDKLKLLEVEKKAAVIPLKRNNSDLVNTANKVKSELQSLGLGRVMVENTGNIGKNYRRHDEIGTPLCVTIDFETLENQTVTVRDRDTMKQEKVSLSEIANYYSRYFK